MIITSEGMEGRQKSWELIATLDKKLENRVYSPLVYDLFIQPLRIALRERDPILFLDVLESEFPIDTEGKIIPKQLTLSELRRDSFLEFALQYVLHELSFYDPANGPQHKDFRAFTSITERFVFNEEKLFSFDANSLGYILNEALWEGICAGWTDTHTNILKAHPAVFSEEYARAIGLDKVVGYTQLNNSVSSTVHTLPLFNGFVFSGETIKEGRIGILNFRDFLTNLSENTYGMTREESVIARRAAATFAHFQRAIDEGIKEMYSDENNFASVTSIRKDIGSEDI